MLQNKSPYLYGICIVSLIILSFFFLLESFSRNLEGSDMRIRMLNLVVNPIGESINIFSYSIVYISHSTKV